MDALEIIKTIITNNKRLKSRIEALEKAGFTVEEKAMGSGGVGQIKKITYI